MIVFKTIRFKNILSYGETFTTMNLDAYETCLFIGKNGSGKSTILEVIVYALFGKPFRPINLKQLKNYKNKSGLLVEIEFTSSGEDYLIRRGMSPVVFEVYKNGVMLDQDGKKLDYQKYLEENILHFDFTSFTQIVILGKATYISFMQLKPHARRQFVESILGAEVFSSMLELHKSNIVHIKEELNETKNQLSVLKTVLDHTKARVKKIKLAAEVELEDKRAAILDKVSVLKQDITGMLEEKSVLLSEIDNGLHERQTLLEKRLFQLATLRARAQSNITTKKNKLQFFMENSSCHSCGQTICEHTRNTTIHDLESDIGTLESALSDLDTKYATTEASLNEVRAIFKSNNEKLSRVSVLETRIKDNKNKIVELSNESNSLPTHFDTSADEAEIVSLQSKIGVILSRRGELASKELQNDLVSQMLKDGGIKRMVVQKYLPMINTLVNKYLGDLGFLARLKLDDEFQETIVSGGSHELSYYNFSEGEKMRIDLALLMTWREIATLRNKMSTNLLIFDEILDASLDQSGIDGLVSLFESIPNSNIVVITHSHGELGDVFNNQLIFEKKGGFSRIYQQ